MRSIHLLPQAEAIAQLLTLFLALLCGAALAIWPLSSGLASAILALGLDPQRTRLLMALLLTGGAAGVGAFAGRRKVGACLGGGAFFCWNYLAGFIQTQWQPVRDPLGNLEPLNGGVLLHTSLVLLALALLVAFAGAAIGRATSEVLIEPFLPLVSLLWQRRAWWTSSRLEQAKATAQRLAPRKTKHALISWMSALLFAGLCLLALGASDLFVYTPDVGLHAAPVLPTRSNEPVNGTLVEDSLLSRALGGQRKPFLVYLPPSYN